MIIEDDIENLVRDALACAVSQKRLRLAAAIETLATDEVTLIKCVDLILAIDVAAMTLAFPGERPSPAQIHELTEKFMESQSWAKLGPTTVKYIFTLTADFTGKTLRRRDPVATMTALFAVGGYLLASHLPKGFRWTDMLDLIEAELERP